MNFDWTINIGQICVAASFITTIAIVFTRQGWDIKATATKVIELDAILTKRLDKMDTNSNDWRVKIEKEMEKQTDILITLARYEQRQTDQDRRLDDLAIRLDQMQAVTHAIGRASRQGSTKENLPPQHP